MKLYKSRICHNVFANDELNGGWHTGYRIPDGKTVVFFYKKKWYASNPSKDENKVLGPFESKEIALKS